MPQIKYIGTDKQASWDGQVLSHGQVLEVSEDALAALRASHKAALYQILADVEPPRVKVKKPAPGSAAEVNDA